MKVLIQEYFKDKDIDIKKVATRYAYLFFKMNLFLDEHTLTKKVIVNTRMLIEAVHDYYVDTTRIKGFHGIEYTNNEKVFAYKAYWLFRRKPLQVIEEFPGCEFINELCITEILTSAMAAEKNIPKEIRADSPSFKKLQALLFYNFKYRPVSPQSLELMIEAFFSGCDSVVK